MLLECLPLPKSYFHVKSVTNDELLISRSIPFVN